MGQYCGKQSRFDYDPFLQPIQQPASKSTAKAPASCIGPYTPPASISLHNHNHHPLYQSSLSPYPYSYPYVSAYASPPQPPQPQPPPPPPLVSTRMMVGDASSADSGRPAAAYTSPYGTHTPGPSRSTSPQPQPLKPAHSVEQRSLLSCRAILKQATSPPLTFTSPKLAPAVRTSFFVDSSCNTDAAVQQQQPAADSNTSSSRQHVNTVDAATNTDRAAGLVRNPSTGALQHHGFARSTSSSSLVATASASASSAAGDDSTAGLPWAVQDVKNPVSQRGRTASPTRFDRRSSENEGRRRSTLGDVEIVLTEPSQADPGSRSCPPAAAAAASVPSLHLRPASGASHHHRLARNESDVSVVNLGERLSQSLQRAAAERRSIHTVHLFQATPRTLQAALNPSPSKEFLVGSSGAAAAYRGRFRFARHSITSIGSEME